MTWPESFLPTPPSPTMVRAMAYAAMIRGGMTNANGSCPGCGTEVPRVHAWSTDEAREAYRCPSCGTFEYTTDGAELPVGADEPAVGARFTIAERPANLRAVLDPVDCVS